MTSYLGASFLAGEVGDEITDLAGPTEQPTDYPVAAPEDMVALPGGILIPRKTFNLLLIVVVVAVALILLRRKKADAAE